MREEGGQGGVYKVSPDLNFISLQSYYDMLLR